jgi:hypothetical protein
MLGQAGFTMIVMDDTAWRWVAAYQEYHRVGQTADASPCRAAAHAVATASWDVASAWRELEATPGLPWWVAAAVNTAAAVFEEQARAWTAHAKVLG